MQQLMMKPSLQVSCLHLPQQTDMLLSLALQQLTQQLVQQLMALSLLWLWTAAC